MKDIANEFRNYQAFVLHYQPVVILKVGRDDYAAYYGGTGAREPGPERDQGVY